MADLTELADNRLKRDVSVFKALGLTEAQLLAIGTLFTLPRNSFISKVDVYINTVSATASSQMDIAVGGTDVATNIPVTVAGVAVMPTLAAARKYPNGGAVTINGGTTPPAAGDLVFDVIIEYVELDKHTGAYTN